MARTFDKNRSLSKMHGQNASMESQLLETSLQPFSGNLLRP